MIDAGTKAGAHALERLERERIAWLTTVTPDGQPQTLPIWFVWEDGTILVDSKKVAARNRNLRLDPKVSFHLADDEGDDIVEIEGEARLDPRRAVEQGPAAYFSQVRRAARPLRLDARVPQRGVPAPVPDRAHRRAHPDGRTRADGAGPRGAAGRRSVSAASRSL